MKPNTTANQINPLRPDIKMHILLTVVHTFLIELVRRIGQKYQDILLLVITFFTLIT